MPSINPYLTFTDNCEEAFNFYKSVFGGEFGYLGRFSEMPEGSPVSEEEANRVMHVSLPIGKGTTLMGSDSPSAMGGVNQGNNFSISVHPESEEEADRIFNGLSEGGEVIMPMSKTFWNAYFGMFKDKFGIQWMVNYEYPQQ